MNIQRFDADGNFIFKFGNIVAVDVALDKSGNIYAADTVNHRIVKFGPDGAFISAFGGIGSSSTYLALDKSGNIYVSDFAAGLVRKFGPSGNLLFQFSYPGV
jgi:DNA-binding beta-propeller fold protein YncE